LFGRTAAAMVVLFATNMHPVLALKTMGLVEAVPLGRSGHCHRQHVPCTRRTATQKLQTVEAPVFFSRYGFEAAARWLRYNGRSDRHKTSRPQPRDLKKRQLSHSTLAVETVSKHSRPKTQWGQSMAQSQDIPGQSRHIKNRC